MNYIIIVLLQNYALLASTYVNIVVKKYSPSSHKLPVRNYRNFFDVKKENGIPEF